MYLYAHMHPTHTLSLPPFPSLSTHTHTHARTHQMKSDMEAEEAKAELREAKGRPAHHLGLAGRAGGCTGRSLWAAAAFHITPYQGRPRSPPLDAPSRPILTPRVSSAARPPRTA